MMFCDKNPKKKFKNTINLIEIMLADIEFKSKMSCCSLIQYVIKYPIQLKSPNSIIT